MRSLGCSVGSLALLRSLALLFSNLFSNSAHCLHLSAMRSHACLFVGLDCDMRSHSTASSRNLSAGVIRLFLPLGSDQGRQRCYQSPLGTVVPLSRKISVIRYS